MDVVADAMTQAVAAANEAGERDWRLESAGPVKGGWSIIVSRHEMKANNPQIWLSSLTEALESRHISGKLTPSNRRLGHDDAQDWESVQQRLYPSLYLSHAPTQPTLDPNAPTGWLASAEATRVRAADAVRQCFTPATPTEQVRGGMHTLSSSVIPLADTGADVVASMASVSRNCGVLAWTDNLGSRRAKFLSGGQYLLSLADAQSSNHEIVDRLRSSLITEPHLANYGFIRTSQWVTNAFHNYLRPKDGHVRPQEAGITGPENPWAVGSRWRQNYHLHSEYAFDAHAVNLLTGRHLERAQDLTNWSVTEVGEDRYLVEARDLQPWFDGKPDPAVLEQARQDFGDMLITWDVVLEKPGPMTVYPSHLPQPGA